MSALFPCCGPTTTTTTVNTNDRLEFLVFLSRKDKKSHCLSLYNRKKVIKTLSDNLQGRLHVAYNECDTCICCDQLFIMSDIIDTSRLYVLVPKEHVYVQFHQWEHEYLKSQVQELVYIFRRMGASNLRITVSQSQGARDIIGGSVHAHLHELGISAGIHVSSDTDTSNLDSISTRMTFDTDDCTVNTLKDLFTDPNIHYLSNRPAWQSFVNNRLQGKAKTIQFTFTHHNAIYMSKQLIASMSKAGLSFHDTHREMLWVKMIFEASWGQSDDVTHNVLPPSILGKWETQAHPPKLQKSHSFSSGSCMMISPAWNMSPVPDPHIGDD